MAIQINIQGNLIDIASSGQSPNWANGWIEFAQAVEQALSGLAGPFDIPPQVYEMIANVNTNVDLPNLVFPTSDVRSAEIAYAVYRQSDNPGVADNIKVESGIISIAYNPNNPVTNKWNISQTSNDPNDTGVSFSITDVGQVQFSSTLQAGSNYEGRITYQAKALLQST